VVDLDLIALDSLMHSLFLQAFNLEERPIALWRPLPPGVAGIKKTFMEAKLGRGIDKWFCQNRHQFTPANVKYAAFVSYSLYMSRICGARFPRPEFVPVTQSGKLAEWLAEKVGAGSPGHLDTNATCAVRVLQAAKEKGLDVSGSFFRVGGEPYTSAKAKLVAEAGCDAAVHYSMGEAGHIGIACGDPKNLDDVHLVTHKMAALKRPIRTSAGKFEAFYLTTLANVCPKIMLNVAIGDSGVLEERKCSCAIGELGFHRHIHSIRSYEKLTSEGMQFLGSDLLLLLEQVLPSQFGGGPQDYQFVEREEDGVTRVELLVSRRLGPLSDSELLRVALDFLGSRARENRMMVERWKEGGILVVRRAEPYVTKAAKLLPLHIMPKDR
jgi:hypothetical protein